MMNVVSALSLVMNRTPLLFSSESLFWFWTFLRNSVPIFYSIVAEFVGREPFVMAVTIRFFVSVFSRFLIFQISPSWAFNFVHGHYYYKGSRAKGYLKESRYLNDYVHLTYIKLARS